MDNAGFTGDSVAGVELKEVRMDEAKPVAPPSCEPGKCTVAIKQYEQLNKAINLSPWDKSKTAFLLVFILLFVAWIIVFSSLSKFGFL